MKAVFLELKGHGPTFLAEEPDPNEESADPGQTRGVRKWLQNWRARFLVQLEDPESPISPTVGRVWRALQRLIAPDEYLFRSLRLAGSLSIDHAAGIGFETVQNQWLSYLARTFRKHLAWLIVDALLAPASLFLALVPGPNVVGYWVLYRAVVHALVVIGARRALQGKIPITYRAMEGLDGPIDAGDHEQINRLSEVLAWPDLGLLIQRVAPTINPE